MTLTRTTANYHHNLTATSQFVYRIIILIQKKTSDIERPSSPNLVAIVNINTLLHTLLNND